MAKGIPLMGRDPDGKAKMINVDENGNVIVQQSGTIVEVKTVINAASVLPGEYASTKFNIKGEDQLWVAVNCDQSPWRMQVQSFFGRFTPHSAYPPRTEENATLAITRPIVSFYHGLPSAVGLKSPESMLEAKQLRLYNNDTPIGIAVYNDSATIATVTVRIIRVF